MADGPPITYDQDLGSLSPFTPPATCLDRITSLVDPRAGLGNGKDRTYFVGMIGNSVDRTCYPPSYSTDVIYPTGSCPSGWVNACFPTYVTALSDSALTLGIFPTGFPGVQCCPSGFTCYDPFFCGSSAPPTKVTALLVSPTTSVTQISISAGDQIWAKPIFVVSAAATTAQSTSADSVSTTAQSTSAETTSTTSIATSDCPPAHSSSSSGLSTEGKIALAAVIPVTVFAMIVAGLWFLLNRRSSLRHRGELVGEGLGTTPTKGNSNMYTVGELPYHPGSSAQYVEMDGTTRPTELNAGGRLR